MYRTPANKVLIMNYIKLSGVLGIAQGIMQEFNLYSYLLHMYHTLTSVSKLPTMEMRKIVRTIYPPISSTMMIRLAAIDPSFSYSQLWYLVYISSLTLSEIRGLSPAVYYLNLPTSLTGPLEEKEKCTRMVTKKNTKTWLVDYMWA